MVRGTTYFLYNIGSLLEADYIAVTYEDLCAEPETQVARILQFLGIQPRASVAYDALVAPRHLGLLPELARRQKHICRKLQPYADYSGYVM
jgi:Sulfotransferase domain